MALELADHVFRILENQQALFDFLGEHRWGYAMEDGLLTLTSAADGRILADCPAQVLGSQSDADGSWLWAWANEQSQIPKNLLRAVESVRSQAEAEGNALFTASEPIEPEEDDDLFGPRLAIVAAGAANLYTYYACGYDGGCLFVGIESPPPGVRTVGDATRAVHALQMGLSALDFDHRRAALAYLGEPIVRRGDTLIWTLGPEAVALTFDDRDRIARIETTQAPKPRP